MGRAGKSPPRDGIAALEQTCAAAAELEGRQRNVSVLGRYGLKVQLPDDALSIVPPLLL